VRLRRAEHGGVDEPALRGLASGPGSNGAGRVGGVCRRPRRAADSVTQGWLTNPPAPLIRCHGETNESLGARALGGGLGEKREYMARFPPSLGRIDGSDADEWRLRAYTVTNRQQNPAVKPVPSLLAAVLRCRPPVKAPPAHPRQRAGSSRDTPHAHQPPPRRRRGRAPATPTHRPLFRTRTADRSRRARRR
jgi:hypothetical protein